MTLTAVAPATTTTPTYGERRWRALPVVLIATFMALFDLFVVNVAAPSIEVSLGTSSAGLELVVAGYSFTYAAGLVTGGRLGDRYGRRLLFVLGMALFTLASLLCGVAPGVATLVAGRLLQGAGAALMVPQVLALITVMFPPAERARAFALFGATVGIGSVAGQVLGGVLLSADLFGTGWRAVFLVNVPIGIAAILGTLRLVPESHAVEHARLDLLGLTGLTAGLGLLLAPLVLGRSEGWPLWTWASLAASAVALGAFVTWELHLARTGGHPIVPPALLRMRHVSAGLLVNLGFFVFFGSFLLTMTVFLQQGQGDSPLRAGLTFAPLGVTFALASLAGRGLVARLGSRALTLGATVSLTALVLLAVLVHVHGVHIAVLELSPVLALIGVGNGLTIPALVAAVLQGVPSDDTGAVSGVLTTTQQLAAALGIAVIGDLFFSRLASAGAGPAMELAVLAEIVAVMGAIGATLLIPRARA